MSFLHFNTAISFDTSGVWRDWCIIFAYEAKGQLNSEWIDEVIVSPKMPTKNYQDFCPGSLLEGKAEILQIFGSHFGRNGYLFNSFWI